MPDKYKLNLWKLSERIDELLWCPRHVWQSYILNEIVEDF